MDKKKIVILDAWATVPGDISWDPIAAMGDLTIYDRTPAALAPTLRQPSGPMTIRRSRTWRTATSRRISHGARMRRACA